VVSAGTYFDVQESDAVPVGSRQGAIFPAGGHVLNSFVGAPVVPLVDKLSDLLKVALVAVSSSVRLCPEHRRGAPPNQGESALSEGNSYGGRHDTLVILPEHIAQRLVQE